MFLDDGLIPNYRQFFMRWSDLKRHEYHFHNDDRMGTCTLIRDELWDEIKTVHNEMIEIEEASHFDSRQYLKRYEWLKSVLLSLGINWR